MGEYALYRGTPVKLGTCEDLFYVRYADFARMVAAGEIEQYLGNDAPAEYLRGGSRFRFPFPDEDDLAPFTYQNFNRGFVVNVTAAPDLVTMAEHGRATASFHPDGGGYNVNVSVPCPQTDDFETVRSSGIDWRIVEIVQQRPIEGRLWTILQCPYCKARWRLDADHAQVLVDCLLAAGSPFHKEMARRVLAGYEVAL